MKPYRLKHVPTGLYFQPTNNWNNLSKKGKIYTGNSNGLTGYQDTITLNINPNTDTGKLALAKLTAASVYQQGGYSKDRLNYRANVNEFVREYIKSNEADVPRDFRILSHKFHNFKMPRPFGGPDQIVWTAKVESGGDKYQIDLIYMFYKRSMYDIVIRNISDDDRDQNRESKKINSIRAMYEAECGLTDTCIRISPKKDFTRSIRGVINTIKVAMSNI